MSSRFNLTAELTIQAVNIRDVARTIRRELRDVVVTVRVEADTRDLETTRTALERTRRSADEAGNSMEAFGRNAGLAAKRFAGFTIATAAIVGLARAITNATKEAIGFERELVKISQVTGKTTKDLKDFTSAVTNTATTMGVASSSLLTVSRTLAQAGLTARQTAKAMNILAKTDLAPTFDNLTATTEGAIAILRQFGAQGRTTAQDIANLEKQLGAINAVSKKFAVESADLITAVRRTGGVFKSAGGNLNELIGLFTSVRATTRESAETIATGFRTIFTRIQRVETIDQLKKLGIQLQDVRGKFVGPMEAIRRLSQALKTLDPKDFRFNQIVEQLGGFRQISKVIPLIQQFDVATRAYTVAQRGANSLTTDAQKAQKALQVQISKVKEEFSALVRKVADSESFRTMVDLGLKLASAFIKVADALTPLLPMLVTLSTLRIGMAIPSFARGLRTPVTRGGGGPIKRFASGGVVPGQGNRDTVPAMLTPGEFVIKKSSVKSLGAGNLHNMNKRGRGGSIQRFSNGGGPKRQQLKSGSLRFAGTRDRVGALVMSGGKSGDQELLDVGVGTALRDAGTAAPVLKKRIASKKKAGTQIDRVQATIRSYNPSDTFREDFDRDVRKPLQESLSKIASRGPKSVRQQPEYQKEITKVLDEQRNAISGSLAEASIRGYAGVFRKPGKKNRWEFSGGETSQPGFADLLGDKQFSKFKGASFVDIKDSLSDTARGSMIGKIARQFKENASGIQLQNRGGFIQRLNGGGTVGTLSIKKRMGLLAPRGESFEGDVNRNASSRSSAIVSFLDPIAKEIEGLGLEKGKRGAIKTAATSPRIKKAAKLIGLRGKVVAASLDPENKNQALYNDVYNEILRRSGAIKSASTGEREKGEELFTRKGIYDEGPGRLSKSASKKAGKPVFMGKAPTIIKDGVKQVLTEKGVQAAGALAANFAIKSGQAQANLAQGKQITKKDLSIPLGQLWEDILGGALGVKFKEIKSLANNPDEKKPFDFFKAGGFDDIKALLDKKSTAFDGIEDIDAKPDTGLTNRKELVKKGFNKGLFTNKQRKKKLIKEAVKRASAQPGYNRGGAVGFIDGGEVSAGGHFSVSSDTMGLGSWQAVKKFAAEIRGGAYPGIKKINFIAGPSGSGKTFQSKKLGAAPLMDFADAATASQLTFEIGGNKIDNVLDTIALAKKTGGAGIYLSPADEQLDKQRRRRAAKSKVGRGDPLDKRSAKALRGTKRAPRSGDEASLQMLKALQREFPNLQVKKFASGGGVGTDTVPALLTPGEFVINKDSASRIGRGNLERMNSVGKFAAGGAVGRVQKFQGGGSVDFGDIAIIGSLLAPVVAEMINFQGVLGKQIKEFTTLGSKVGVLTFLFISVGKALRDIERASDEAAKALDDARKAAEEAAEAGEEAPEEPDKGESKAARLALLGFSFAAAAGITVLQEFAHAANEATEAAIKAGNVQEAIAQGTRSAQLEQTTAVAGVSSTLAGLAVASSKIPGPLKILAVALAAAATAATYFNDVLEWINSVTGGATNFTTRSQEGDVSGFAASVTASGKRFKMAMEAITRAGLQGRDAFVSTFGAINQTASDAKVFQDRTDAVKAAGGNKELVAAYQEQADKVKATLGGQEQNLRKGLSSYIKSQVDAGKDFAQIKNSAEFKKSMALFRKIFMAMGMSADDAKKAIAQITDSAKNEVEQKARLAAAAAAQAAAFAALRQRVDVLNIGLNALGAAANDAKLGMRDLKVIAGQGGVGAERVDFSGVIKDVAKVGDLGRFKRVADQAGAIFGQAGQKLAKEAIDVATVFRRMPEVVTTLASAGLSAGQGLDDVKNAIDTLDPAILAALPPELRDKFLTAITKKIQDLKGKPLTAQEVQAEVDKLAKEFNEVNGLLSKGLKEFNQNIKRLGDGFKQLTKITMERVKAESDLVSAQLKNAKTLSEVGGGRLSLGARENFRRDRQRAILGPQNAGLAGNAGGIGNELRKTKDEIRKADKALQGFSATGQMGANLANEYALQAKNLQKLNEKSKRLTMALKDLVTSAQGRASDIKEELDLAKKEREVRSTLLKDWTFATNEGRASINKSFAALTQAINAGDIDAISDEMRPAVGKILEQFADVELIPGMTGDKIAKQFQVRVLDKMLKAQGRGGVTQRQIKQIFESTSKEDRLIGDLQRAFAAEDNARKQWIAVLAQQETQVLSAIQQMHTDFINRLNNMLVQLQAATGGGGGGAAGVAVPTIAKGHVPYAANGIINGPKGKDDDLVWMDKEGEAIMNAGATKENAPLLRAMNAKYAQKGKVPGGGGVPGLGGLFKPLTDSTDRLTKAIESLVGELKDNKGAIIDALGDAAKDIVEGMMQRGAASAGASAGSLASGAIEGIIGKGEISEAVGQGVGDAVKGALSTGQSPEASGKEAAKNIRKAMDKKPSWLDKFKAYSNAAALGLSGGKVAPFAAGGSVFAPRGTDTVPAMLTPGEFVVRKSAVDKIGVGALNSINTGYYSGGGLVQYLKNGGGAKKVPVDQEQATLEQMAQGNFSDTSLTPRMKAIKQWLASSKRLTVDEIRGLDSSDAEALGFFDLINDKGDYTSRAKSASTKHIIIPPRPSSWNPFGSAAREKWDKRYGHYSDEEIERGSATKNVGLTTNYKKIRSYLAGAGDAGGQVVTRGAEAAWNKVAIQDKGIFSEANIKGFQAIKRGDYTGDRGFGGDVLEGTRSLGAGFLQGTVGTVATAGTGLYDFATGEDTTSAYRDFEAQQLGKASRDFQGMEQGGRILGTVALMAASAGTLGAAGAGAGVSTGTTVAVGAVQGSLMSLAAIEETIQSMVKQRAQEDVQALKIWASARGDSAALKDAYPFSEGMPLDVKIKKASGALSAFGANATVDQISKAYRAELRTRQDGEWMSKEMSAGAWAILIGGVMDAITFGAASKAAKVGGPKAIAAAAGVAGLSGGIEAGLENALVYRASGIDPDKDLSEGVLMRAGIGAAVGGAMSGASARAARKGRGVADGEGKVKGGDTPEQVKQKVEESKAKEKSKKTGPKGSAASGTGKKYSKESMRLFKEVLQNKRLNPDGLSRTEWLKANKGKAEKLKARMERIDRIKDAKYRQRAVDKAIEGMNAQGKKAKGTTKGTRRRGRFEGVDPTEAQVKQFEAELGEARARYEGDSVRIAEAEFILDPRNTLYDIAGLPQYRPGGPKFGKPLSADAVATMKKRFKALQKKHHPDRGGDPRIMRRLTEAETLKKGGRLVDKYNAQLKGGKIPYKKGSSTDPAFDPFKKTSGLGGGGGTAAPAAAKPAPQPKPVAKPAAATPAKPAPVEPVKAGEMLKLTYVEPPTSRPQSGEVHTVDISPRQRAQQRQRQRNGLDEKGLTPEEAKSRQDWLDLKEKYRNRPKPESGESTRSRFDNMTESDADALLARIKENTNKDIAAGYPRKEGLAQFLQAKREYARTKAKGFRKGFDPTAKRDPRQDALHDWDNVVAEVKTTKAVADATETTKSSLQGGGTKSGGSLGDQLLQAAVDPAAVDVRIKPPSDVVAQRNQAEIANKNAAAENNVRNKLNKARETNAKSDEVAADTAVRNKDNTEFLDESAVKKAADEAKARKDSEAARQKAEADEAAAAARQKAEEAAAAARKQAEEAAARKSEEEAASKKSKDGEKGAEEKKKGLFGRIVGSKPVKWLSNVLSIASLSATANWIREGAKKEEDPTETQQGDAPGEVANPFAPSGGPTTGTPSRTAMVSSPQTATTAQAAATGGAAAVTPPGTAVAPANLGGAISAGASAAGGTANIYSPGKISQIIKDRISNTPFNKVPKKWRGAFRDIAGGGDTEKYFPAVMSSARSLQNLLSEGMIASASAGKIQFSQKALGKKEDILSSFPFGAPPLLGTGPLGPGELTAYQKGLPEYLRDYTTVSRAAMRLQAGITGEMSATDSKGKPTRRHKAAQRASIKHGKTVAKIQQTLAKLRARRDKLKSAGKATAGIDKAIARQETRLQAINQRFQAAQMKGEVRDLVSTRGGRAQGAAAVGGMIPQPIRQAGQGAMNWIGGIVSPAPLPLRPQDIMPSHVGPLQIRPSAEVRPPLQDDLGNIMHPHSRGPADPDAQRREAQRQRDRRNNPEQGRFPLLPEYRAMGGSIPSMGSDTVPAMLTPGEFIMSKGAVSKYGAGFMKSLNRGGIQGYNKGGLVQYLQNGSKNGPVKSNGNGGINVDGAGIAEALVNQAPAIGNMMGQGIGSSLKPVLDNFTSSFAGAVGASGLDAFVAGLSSAATMFNTAASTLNGLEMTCNISFEGPLTLGGIDVPGFADAITEALGDHVKNLVNDQLSKRPNRVTGGK